MSSTQPKTERVALRADRNYGAAHAQVNVQRAQARNTKNLISRGCWIPGAVHGASHWLGLSVGTLPFAELRRCAGQNEEKPSKSYFRGFHTAGTILPQDQFLSAIISLPSWFLALSCLTQAARVDPTQFSL